MISGVFSGARGWGLDNMGVLLHIEGGLNGFGFLDNWDCLYLDVKGWARMILGSLSGKGSWTLMILGLCEDNGG